MNDVRTPAVDLSILIVCYNSRSDIDRCLTSVLQGDLGGLTYEVLLLNNSPDGLEDYIRLHYPSVRIIDNNRNLGFGPGNNLLAQHARSDRLLLLNPDTDCPPGAIRKLYQLSRRLPDHGAWGGATRFEDGSREYSSLQAAPTVINELLRLLGLSRLIKRKTMLEPRLELVDVLSGAFMLVDANLWRTLKGFDERFFMYSEEVDLCRRIMDKTGLKLPLASDVWVYHFVGKSSNPAGRMNLIFRGKMQYDRKHFPLLHSLALGLILYATATTRFAGGALLCLAGRQGKARELVESYTTVMNPAGWFRLN